MNAAVLVGRLLAVGRGNRAGKAGLLVLAGVLSLVSCCTDGLCAPPDATQPPRPVAGKIVTVGDAKVLVLRGTHKERGYAHGYLRGSQVKAILDNLFVPSYFQRDAALYGRSRQFIQDNFTYDAKYKDEAQALIEGMAAVGVNLHDPVLKRDLDYFDILMLNTMEEIISLAQVPDFGGCSSLSSWGDATRNDPVLQGGVVITRFWDYPEYPPFTHLTENLLLIVHLPAEPDEQNWVGIGWAGVIGTCTGMNRSGVGAFLDYGNFRARPNPGPHHAIALSLRSAIEQRDYNHDNVCSSQDVIDAVKAFTPCFSTIVHVVSGGATDERALIIESNNAKGAVVRRPADNAVAIGRNLIATNHFRVLYPPVPCRRYEKMESLLSADASLTGQRSWDVLTLAAGTARSIYKVQYAPAPGKIRWAFATADQAAAWRPDMSMSFEELLRLGD